MDMKRVLCLLLILSVLCASWLLASCGEEPAPASDPAVNGGTPSSGDPSSGQGDSSGQNADASKKAELLAEWQSTYTAGNFGIVNSGDPFVVLEVEGFGSIRLELFPNYAPISVENFLRYVEEGFYDGVVFHRVIEGFMVQAGGFSEQNGVAVQKTATYPNIKGEFVYNGVKNYIWHFPGVLSMARYGDGLDEEGNIVEPRFDTASSQFFICTARDYSLDGLYAAFGRVIDEESMAVAYAIEKVQTATGTLYYGSTPISSKDVPITLPKITRAWAVR